MDIDILDGEGQAYSLEEWFASLDNARTAAEFRRRFAPTPGVHTAPETGPAPQEPAGLEPLEDA